MTRNVRRSDDDRLKRSKHVALHTINKKIVGLDIVYYYALVYFLAHRDILHQLNFSLVIIFLSQEIFVFLEMLRRAEKLYMNLGAIHAPNSAILTKAFKGQLQTETSTA